MNWDEIKEKHPKAWEKLNRWAKSEGFSIEFITTGGESLGRILYDFFDEKKVYIDVGPTLNYKEGVIRNTPHGLLFSSEVYTKHERNGHDRPFLYEETFGSFWDSRIEAEEKAFEKAFEILENINN